MNCKFLIAAAMIVFSSPALAADYTFEAPLRPTFDYSERSGGRVSGDQWNGPYAGVTLGYGWDRLRGTLNGYETEPEKLDGLNLGGFAGYNNQFSNSIVLGLEGDFEYAWNENAYPLGRGLDLKTGTTWGGSLRGRIGVAAGRALFYGTAGVAVSNLDVARISDLGISKTMWGYTVGAGVDYAFTDMIFGRLEYRYTGYPEADVLKDAARAVFPDTPVDLGVKMHSNTVRAGLGVKF